MIDFDVLNQSIQEFESVVKDFKLTSGCKKDVCFARRTVGNQTIEVRHACRTTGKSYEIRDASGSFYVKCFDIATFRRLLKSILKEYL